jgi:hypothetical protein
MNNNYDQYLTGEITITAVLLCVLIIAGLIITRFGIEYYKKHQTDDAIACGAVVLIAIVVCIVGLVYSIPAILDIKDQSYIRYEGVFYVTDGEYDLRAGSQPLIKFDDEENSERFKVRCNTYLSNGCHEGYIVYSKRSKKIVEWYCNDCTQK